MHEFSHIICGHECVKLDVSTFGIPLRTYDDEIEEEAKWMGATLQLPREALIWALKKQMTDEQISDYFTATLEMVRFRKNTSGVAIQMDRFKRRYN